MKVDNFVSNRLKNYIWYISVTTRPPQVCIPGNAPAHLQVKLFWLFVFKYMFTLKNILPLMWP